MALAFTLLTEGGSASDATSYNTASITVADDDLILVAVMGGLTSPINPAPAPTSITGASLSGGSALTVISQGQVEAQLVNGSLWRAESTGAASGALTINWGNTQAGCRWAVIRVTGQTLGSNGASAVKQTVTSYAPGTGTTHSLTMAALGSGNNQTLAAFFGERGGSSTPATSTPGNSFTEVSDGGTGDATIPAAFSITTIRRSATDPAITWNATVHRAAIGIEVEELVVGGAAIVPIIDRQFRARWG